VAGRGVLLGEEDLIGEVADVVVSETDDSSPIEESCSTGAVVAVENEEVAEFMGPGTFLRAV
jgi:hypothetical protein